MSVKEATAKNEVIMVIDEDNSLNELEDLDIIKQYKKLSEKCDNVLKKIKQRKSKK